MGGPWPSNIPHPWSDRGRIRFPFRVFVVSSLKEPKGV